MSAMLSVEIRRRCAEAARCPLCESPGSLFETSSPDHVGVECRWCGFADVEEIAGLV